MMLFWKRRISWNMKLCSSTASNDIHLMASKIVNKDNKINLNDRSSGDERSEIHCHYHSCNDCIWRWSSGSRLLRFHWRSYNVQVQGWNIIRLFQFNWWYCCRDMEMIVMELQKTENCLKLIKMLYLISTTISGIQLETFFRNTTTMSQIKGRAGIWNKR